MSKDTGRVKSSPSEGDGQKTYKRGAGAITIEIYVFENLRERDKDKKEGAGW